MVKREYIFRFDDICLNSRMEVVYNMISLLKEKLDCNIILALSILSTAMDNQRVFPSIWNAHSDFKVFYKTNQIGFPTIPKGVELASHGLVHVDHRLLSYGAQEMSILTSCNLINTFLFVPPFNKWNEDTIKICRSNHIDLIKFEDGWLNMKFEVFNPNHHLWYLHHREFTLPELTEWILRIKEK